jgi:GntR family transcriptional repressor for pyruvate dehydrogenase complex
VERGSPIVRHGKHSPIERRKVYEQLAEQLLAQIASGRLAPGEPLPTERELTESFGVGRSSVREALRMLESQGVIVGRGGTLVVATAANPLHSSLRLLFALDGAAGIHDLFELRRILDCEAAALAAERRSEAHLAAMGAATAEMAAALAAGEDGERFIDADVRFHLAVAEATGNRLLLHNMEAVRDAVRRALLRVFLIPGSPEHAVREHHAIRAAIAAGEPGRARAEMRAHLVRVETDVFRIQRDLARTAFEQVASERGLPGERTAGSQTVAGRREDVSGRHENVDTGAAGG